MIAKGERNLKGYKRRVCCGGGKAEECESLRDGRAFAAHLAH
jgi:hypothetical protein